MRLIVLLTLLVLGLAACGDDPADSGGSEAAPSTAAATATDADDASSPTPDPAGPAQSVTEQSQLGVALGSLPLPAGSAPMGSAVAEGNAVSQTFRVQGIKSAGDVLSDDYLGALADDDWDEEEPVEDRGDGVAATFRREELELLLVAQDGPADSPAQAVLNVIITDTAQ